MEIDEEYLVPEEELMFDRRVLTVLAPVYNEEESLPRFVEEMDKFLDQSTIPAKVLFVNDGSSDGSIELIKSICQEKQYYEFISLDRNYGLSTAIKAGIDTCDTQFLGYIDTDLQTSPADFMSFYPFLQEYDMVTGIRVERHDPFIKRMSSRIANAIRDWMIQDGVADTGCPLKIMRSSSARKIPFFDGMHRFLPALIQLYGGKIKQVPVKHYARIAGKSKYHLFNRLFGPFIDALVFMWMRKKVIKYKIASSSNG